MSKPKIRKVAWLVGALCALVAWSPPVAAQGLGDAAKKEKARRTQPQTQNAPVKSYTQDDIKSSGSASAAEAPASQEPPVADPYAGAATGSLDDEAALRRNSEFYWRERVADSRSCVEVARRQHQTLASMTLVPGYVYVDAKGRMVIRTIEELQSLTARAKHRLDSAERALEDLLEEARRKSVPPGWLR